MSSRRLPNSFTPPDDIAVVCGGYGFKVTREECQDALWRSLLEARMEALMDRLMPTDADPVTLIGPLCIVYDGPDG